jgi:hypothetical protein
MGEAHSKHSLDRPHASNGLGALARVGWMVVGTIMILSLGMSIASQPAWSFTIRDAVFWGATVATGLIRYIDVTRLDGQTAQGDPATTRDLTKYLIALAAIALLLWLGAHSVRL